MVDYSALKLQAWDSTDVSDAAVHMAIRRLRQKLKQVASEAEGDGLIRERRGIVYSISIEQIVNWLARLSLGRHWQNQRKHGANSSDNSGEDNYSVKTVLLVDKPCGNRS